MQSQVNAERRATMNIFGAWNIDFHTQNSLIAAFLMTQNKYSRLFSYEWNAIETNRWCGK